MSWCSDINWAGLSNQLQQVEAGRERPEPATFCQESSYTACDPGWFESFNSRYSGTLSNLSSNPFRGQTGPGRNTTQESKNTI
jgi:hypothetical protein